MENISIYTQRQLFFLCSSLIIGGNGSDWRLEDANQLSVLQEINLHVLYLCLSVSCERCKLKRHLSEVKANLFI